MELVQLSYFLQNIRQKFVKTVLQIKFSIPVYSYVAAKWVGSLCLDRVVSGQQESLSDTVNCFFVTHCYVSLP